MGEEHKTLNLGITGKQELLPVVTAFVEQSARVYGLGSKESLEMTLAVEEVFIYLSKYICPGAPMEIFYYNGIYYGKVMFVFPGSSPNLSGLNISRSGSFDSESSLRDMGLMLAARFSDGLYMQKKKQDKIELEIRKDRVYTAKFQTGEIGRPLCTPGFTIVDSQGEHLMLLGKMACQFFQRPFAPPFFEYPQKIADMVESGEYEALAALNEKAEIIGGILVFRRSDIQEQFAEIFGPYVFIEDEDKKGAMERSLIEAAIEGLARTKVIGLVAFRGVPSSIKGDFDRVGTIRVYSGEGKPLEIDVLYRILHEDPGGVVWLHRDIQGFLKSYYENIFLAREMRVLDDPDGIRGGASIFAVEFHREKFLDDVGHTVIMPLEPGSDFDANVRGHVDVLRQENIRNIFFAIDLGVPWHGYIIPPLLANNFKPAYVIPMGGVSDRVVFQHHET